MESVWHSSWLKQEGAATLCMLYSAHFFSELSIVFIILESKTYYFAYSVSLFELMFLDPLP